MAHQRLLEHRSLMPTVRRYPRPLLFIHGAWHGAWCWEQAMQDFARCGFEVHAISLRGHGESDLPRGFNLCGIDDYLRDIATAIDGIEPSPVIIAHSMGGFLMQHYAASHEVSGLVLLCAIPHTGAWRFLSAWLCRHPGAAIQVVLTLNTRYLVGTPRLARTGFFRPTAPDAQVAAAVARLCPESIRVAIESIVRLPAPRPTPTPTLVIAAERDAVFTEAEQQALAAAYHADLVLIPEAAHDLMLDPAWPLAADRIEQAAARWM
ncbi:MAG: alpha/beta hydrolase [Chloroflexales bacterium]|nr:alpha/beta hydrolase [Chloroflexales bacterium]